MLAQGDKHGIDHETTVLRVETSCSALEKKDSEHMKYCLYIKAFMLGGGISLISRTSSWL